MRRFQQILVPTLFFFLFGMATSSFSQHNAEYIYGRLVTTSNETYEGFMRWGKEELLWHDIFNSQKVFSKNDRFKKGSENSGLWEEFRWNISSIWEDKYRTTGHLFSCYFGDIKSIQPKSSDKVALELKNGTIINLQGASNDVGSYIKLYDFELGMININWKKIKLIEFSQAAANIENPFGYPIYGTVTTMRKGQITGYIKWDMEERVSTDVIDGDSKYGDQQIPLSKISEIKKHEDGAYITLHSDRQIFLDGSNDINSSNRDIEIYNPDVGSVRLKWKEFKHLHIHEPPKHGPQYLDFIPPKGIESEVFTYDDQITNGLVVFDIDEKWEIEFIDGMDDNIEYQVPIRNIKSIIPKNKYYSLVNLCSGDQLLLGEKQDVSNANDGILIFIEGNKNPKLIEWHKISEIKFK